MRLHSSFPQEMDEQSFSPTIKTYTCAGVTIQVPSLRDSSAPAALRKLSFVAVGQAAWPTATNRGEHHEQANDIWNAALGRGHCDQTQSVFCGGDVGTPPGGHPQPQSESLCPD